MKKILFSILCLCLISFQVVATEFPVIEPFYGGGIQNTWEEFWTTETTLEETTPAAEGIDDSPKGDGFFGKNNLNYETGAASGGKVIGEITDADYTLQAYIYTRVTDAPDDNALLEDYWYQMIIFYQGENYLNYGRFHTHFNTHTDFTPRIRCQAHGTGWANAIWYDPGDFTVPESDSWHKMKIVLSGTTATCYFDETELGLHDWTSDEPTINAGKFGFAQYIDAAGDKALYIDMFKAWQGAEPPDPTPTPTPTPTPPPISAQNWIHYG